MKMYEVVHTNQEERTSFYDCTIVEHYTCVVDADGEMIELGSPHILPNGYNATDVANARKDSIAFFRTYMAENNVKQVSND